MSPKPCKEFRIGICGLGTVGGGTLRLLSSNSDEILARSGARVSVTHIATRSLQPEQSGLAATTGTDPFAVVNDADVDIVVEAMGGYDPAFDVVMQALNNGKHVVTANKALIAERGNDLLQAARDNGVCLAFESAVAGGIPIIKALREGLAANRIQWLAGIINGTANFILTEMRSARRSFAEVLQQAQELGYAEADPTFDVEGIDAAHKLTIMASIAFGIPLQFDKTYTEGISGITPEDLAYASELGYRIKHLGIAQQTEKGIEVRVHPTLVHKRQLLANVRGVGNAVQVHGDFIGSTLYYGPGAGAEATASAVVADIIDIMRLDIAGAKQPAIPLLGYLQEDPDKPIVSMDEIVAEYYLRIPVQDRVGVMAHVSGVLEEKDISIEAIIQKEAVSDSVPIVILTHETPEARINEAISAIESLDDVIGEVVRIRVESFADRKA